MNKTYKGIIDIDTKGADKSIKDLKEEVQDLKTNLTQLDASTDEYSNAAKRAQIATTQLDSAMEKIRQDGELVGEKMGHVARIGAGLAGTFEFVEGAIALTGKESENFEKVMRRVAGAMAITNSLSAMGDAFESIAKISPKAAIALEKFGKTIKGLFKGIPGIVLAATAAIGALFIKIRQDSQQTERYIQGVIDNMSGLLTEEEEAYAKHLATINALKDNQPALLAYYNKNKESIDKVAGSHQDLNDTIQAYIDKAPEYIAYLHKTAVAELVTDELAKKELEIIQKRQEIDELKKKGKEWKAWRRENELGVLNQELTSLQELLNETTKEVALAQQNLPKTTQGPSDETKKLIAKRREYKALQTQLETFASTVAKLNSLPVSPMVESLLAPDSIDLTNMAERNKLVSELNTLLTNTQAKVDGLNVFTQNKDTRKKAEHDLSRLLKGESDETDALKADQKGLLDERDTKTSEYEKGIIDKEAYAEAIMEIDAKIYANEADLEAKMVENKKAGIQQIEDTAMLGADIIGGLMGALADNFEEGSAAYKAFKISETIISTLSGSIKAYESMASIPYVGPVLGAAAAASVIASGIATINQIKSVQPGETESVNASAINMASANPTVQSHVMNDNLNVTPTDNMKVYVTEHDLRSTNKRVRVAESESTF